MRTFLLSLVAILEILVSIQHVSKIYPLYKRPIDRLIEAIPLLAEKRSTEFWALRDVNIRVEKGEFFALVGPNGSGKSTLLQVAAGILQPSRGRVTTRGRVAALLELGAGFNPEFTGRENVYLNGEIMGIKRGEIDTIFPNIVAFAEIGEFMDRPVKEYSSGMYVRLAFATAIHVEPEILIVDEALAVGDAVFANRCIRKLEELKERKVTILFVSHDLGIVKRLADRAALLIHGEVAALGKPSDVVNRYIGLVHELQLREHSEPDKVGSYRHGDGGSRITAVDLVGERTSVMNGETVKIRVRAEILRDMEFPQVGLLIRNRLGLDIWGTNTVLEGIDLGRWKAGEMMEVNFSFDCLLARGEYTLTVATQNQDGSSQDWIDDRMTITVIDAKDVAGVIHWPVRIEWGKRSV